MGDKTGLAHRMSLAHHGTQRLTCSQPTQGAKTHSPGAGGPTSPCGVEGTEGMQGGQGVVDTVGGTCPPPHQQGGARRHLFSCNWGRATKATDSLGLVWMRNVNLCQ